MMHWRSLLPVLLACVMAMTGITMAMARGQMAAAQSMVICTGYGVVTIAVDARGNPVEVVHPCPDCTMALALAPAPVVVQGPPVVLHALTVRPDGPRILPARAPLHSQPRGPPIA